MNFGAIIKIIALTKLKGKQYQKTVLIINGSDCVSIDVGTSDTLKLNELLQKALKGVYKAGFAYKKCGVGLGGIESATAQRQLDWLNPGDSDQRQKLMSCINGLNTKLGGNAVKLGTETITDRWLMRRDHLSPRYTTRFDELLKI